MKDYKMTNLTAITSMRIFYQAMIQVRNELVEEVNEINEEEIERGNVALVLELPAIVLFDEKGSILKVNETGEMLQSFVTAAFEEEMSKHYLKKALNTHSNKDIEEFLKHAHRFRKRN